MISSNPTVTEISTIMGGIIFMWDSGDRAIAAIIFSASIMIPVLKICIMGILLACARFGVPWPVEKVSLVYRITEKIGTLVDDRYFRRHHPDERVPHLYSPRNPGPASLYFCLVVLLTMLSAHYFDPRLLWDKCGANGKP
ncbi:paraquat-inducible protein A [Kingella potus]|nr:paraquat-inducible protein A [Kingella potus]